MTRIVDDKTALLYYHAFDRDYHCTAASGLLGLIEKLPADEAERIYTLANAYVRADDRARQMVGLALDPFVPDSFRGWVTPLIPEEDDEDMPDAETIALARQILEDKKARESGEASSGEAGSKKMA